MAMNYDQDDEPHRTLSPTGRASIRRAFGTKDEDEEEATEQPQPTKKPSLLDIFRAKFMGG